jgi:GGDEF domain-containing protein
MEAALVSRSAEQGALRARNAELAGQLRAAAMQGDDARIRRLLSELLRFQGLTKGQRVSLQLKALLNLVQALRCVALTDELTGLCNWRGFMQTATRLLDVATRDGDSAHLIYFEVNDLERITQSIGRSAGDVLLRQMGNFMRDLFPSYGVYEVIGRAERRAVRRPDDESGIRLAQRDPAARPEAANAKQRSSGAVAERRSRALQFTASRRHRRTAHGRQAGNAREQTGNSIRVVRDDPPHGLTRF